MKKPIFITGTGTDVGKTLVAAIVAEALQADYWKPVQAGFATGTDSLFVKHMIQNKKSVVHPELYRLKMPASPHLAAAAEGKAITVDSIISNVPQTTRPLIVEGAGGLMVPINKDELFLDLIKNLQPRVIIVSKNELGSINHSLLTAAVLRKEQIDVAGWVFTREYQHYENEIAAWSGYPVLGIVRELAEISPETIKKEAEKMLPQLKTI